MALVLRYCTCATKWEYFTTLQRNTDIAPNICGGSMNRITDAEVLLTPKEVAQRFHVNPKTVTRWAKAGKLTAIRTLGGHRRYRESEIIEKLREFKEVETPVQPKG